MAGPSNSKRPASGGKYKAMKENQSHLPSKKNVIPGGKTSHQGKIATKNPVKETNQRKCTPRKVTDSATGPQTFQVQGQSVSPAQSVMAVSSLANGVTSPTQSVAAPHPASLAAVFKEMMDAAEMNQTIVPTMDEIDAEYKHRQTVLIRPASLLLSPHSP